MEQLTAWLRREFAYTDGILDFDKEWSTTSNGVKLSCIVTYTYKYDAND
jgi:hypothetical protein